MTSVASSGTPANSAESEYINTRRACQILGISFTTLGRLADRGLIQWINSSKGKRKRAHYKSLVDFCEKVRVTHKIANRRPVLSAPGLRHRDEDLLPFPLSDTVGATEALAALGFVKTESLVQFVEKGHFEAYHLMPMAPWRVSRSSLLAYLEGLSTHIPKRPYKVSAVSPHF